MSLRLGDTAPDFEAQTTDGPIRFHEWLGTSWGILFSHPGDFTPVCTTELAAISRLQGEFDRRGIRVLGLSIDTLDRHERWVRDVEASHGITISIPLIADAERRIAMLYDMVHPKTTDMSTVRTLFVIDADKKIRLSMTYPPNTGRNFQEVLRAVDSLMLTTQHCVATPASWESGDEVIIRLGVTDHEAELLFDTGWRTDLPYLRFTKDPSPRPSS